jgi:hypothetical protein
MTIDLPLPPSSPVADSAFVDESAMRLLGLAMFPSCETFPGASFDGGAQKMPPRRIAREIYDAVDLSVAASPVLPPGTLVPHGAARQTDGRYTVDDLVSLGGRCPDTFNVEAKEIKLWRARFLVVRDMLYHALTTSDYRHVSEIGFFEIYRHSVRQQIIAAYFPHGLVLPHPESPIGQKLGEMPPPYVFGDGSIAVAVSERKEA